MRAPRDRRYTRPEIRTVAGTRILETLGPVSCGSSQFETHPFEEELTGHGGTGNKDFSF
jgi:hypothetical protein